MEADGINKSKLMYTDHLSGTFRTLLCTCNEQWRRWNSNLRMTDRDNDGVNASVGRH